MTHNEMIQILVDKYTEKLGDTVNLKQRIDASFGQWFRSQLLFGESAGAAPAGEAAGVPTPGMPPPGTGLDTGTDAVTAMGGQSLAV
jgi:hypothetical protein